MTTGGECPKCKYEKLEYEPIEWIDEFEYFKSFRCPNCSFSGAEKFEVEYMGMIDEEGNYI